MYIYITIFRISCQTYFSYDDINSLTSFDVHNQMMIMMKDYITRHNINIMRIESSEDFCQRKFMINSRRNLACGEQFGKFDDINVTYLYSTYMSN